MCFKRFFSSFLFGVSLLFAQGPNHTIPERIQISTSYTSNRSIKGYASYILIRCFAAVRNYCVACFEDWHHYLYGHYIDRYTINTNLEELKSNLQQSFKDSNSKLSQTLQEYKTVKEVVAAIEKKESQLKDELFHDVEAFLIANYDKEIATELKNEAECLKLRNYKTTNPKNVIHELSPTTPYILKIIKLCGIDPKYVSIRFKGTIAWGNGQAQKHSESNDYEINLPYGNVYFKNVSFLSFIILHECSHIILKHPDTKHLVHFIEEKLKKGDAKFEWPSELLKKYALLLRTQELLADIYMFDQLQGKVSQKILNSFVRASLYWSVAHINRDYTHRSPVWEEDNDSTEAYHTYYIRFAYAMRIYELLNQK